MGKYNDILKEKQSALKTKSGIIKFDKVQNKRNPNKIAELVGNKLVLKFPYDIETVMQIKQIPNRKYDSKTKTWSIKSSIGAYQELDKLGFTFDKSAQKEYDSLINKLCVNEFKPNKFDTTKIKLPNNLSLRNYQLDTISFIEQRDGKAILALDPGTGKTPIVCSYIYNHPEIKPIVIVVPSVLKYNWRNELQKWSPGHNINVLEGKKSSKLNKKETDIVIINYDILDDWVKYLKELKPGLLVLDECQIIKSVKGVKRSKAAKSLAKSSKKILPLSGTPVISKSADLWNIINMVEPDLFGSFYEFGNRYCDPKINQWGTTYNGCSNEQELNNILSNFMIRYRKQDVLKDLPEKQFSFIPLELDNRNDYNKAENDFIEYVRERKGNQAAIKISYAETLAKMTELRQLAVNGALNNSVVWIKNFLENSNEKIVVFAIHKTVLNRLENEFKDICIKIDGSTPSGEYRQNLINSFQNDEKIRVAILQEKSAGTGITLTASSNCVFLEMPFTPADIEQCYGRIDRIGQKNNMNIYFLLPENTIEDKLSLIISKKYDIINKVIEGNFDIETEEKDTVSKLINELNK